MLRAELEEQVWLFLAAVTGARRAIHILMGDIAVEAIAEAAQLFPTAEKGGWRVVDVQCLLRGTCSAA